MFPQQKQQSDKQSPPHSDETHRVDTRPCQRMLSQHRLHADVVVFSYGRRILPARPAE